jgi:chromate transporter
MSERDPHLDERVRRERRSERPALGERLRAAAEVFLVAGRLGLTSFGGPVAHIGYFRREYVERRGWLSDEDFADLVGLCQFLPGPASSQLGIAIGMSRARLLGGVAAWLAFTAPSTAAMIVFALLFRGRDLGGAGWVHGLKVVAVAVVAQAVWSMWRSLAPDRGRSTLAVAAAVTVLLWTSPVGQVAVIAAGALVGLGLLRSAAVAGTRGRLEFGLSRRAGVAALAVFAALLLALPILRHTTGDHTIAFTDAFYRSGALVFGGGHVVLPLLQAQVVPPGWVSQQDFLAGYGAAQAVPGPLFTFAAYLGAVTRPAPNGVPGGLLALAAIFLPAFLLVVGTVPFWSGLRRRPSFLAALAGVNAAVVGLLVAALYHPVFTSAVTRPRDFAVAVAAFAALIVWRLPPWVVVLACAAAGQFLL